MRLTGLRLAAGRSVLALLALLALVGTVLAPAAGSRPVPSLPQLSEPGPSYYLSLGDSLAFGLQPDQAGFGTTDPAAYHSYAEDYARLNRGLTLVNYGCPGETTGTLVAGGCPWAASLHDSYGAASSQLGASVAFLSAHPGQVHLVTVDIGSNDLLALVDRCRDDATSVRALPACLSGGLPATLAVMATNYTTILTTLQALAPSARFVIFNMYNPLGLILPESDALIDVVNQMIAALASAFHAELADAFGTINGKSGAILEKLSLCTLTWECTPDLNIHPNTAGYWALTLALMRAS
jgi:lysophospholipase L1-like esterase